MLGLKGNEMAWQNKKWDSVEHFHAVQRKWALWTAIVYALIFVLAFLAVFLPALMKAQSEAGV